MFFGLPWFAVVAIVAIVGGLILRYREQELQMEAKTVGNLKQLRELQKNVENLQQRIENLEAIITEDDDVYHTAGLELEDEEPISGDKKSDPSIKTRTS